MGLRLHERALVTGGHVCAVGARQWMVGWNVTVVVGGHFHYCCWGVGGDYRRSAIAVEAMDSGVCGQAGGVGVKSGRLAGGGGLKRGVAVRESVGFVDLGAAGWCWLLAGCRWRWWVVVGCSTQRQKEPMRFSRRDGVVGALVRATTS